MGSVTHRPDGPQMRPGPRDQQFFLFVSDVTPVPPRYHPVLEYLSWYLHGALLRIAAPSPSESIDILSPREKTVLNWMRHGKPIGKFPRSSA